MALCGVYSTPNLRSFQVLHNSSIGLKRNRSNLWQPTSSLSVKFHCSASVKPSSSNVEEMDEDVQNSSLVSVEDESAHVKQFKWSDFKILDRVSIGHGGRVLLPNLILVLVCFLLLVLWICLHFTN